MLGVLGQFAEQEIGWLEMDWLTWLVDGLAPVE